MAVGHLLVVLAAHVTPPATTPAESQTGINGLLVAFIGAAAIILGSLLTSVLPPVLTGRRRTPSSDSSSGLSSGEIARLDGRIDQADGAMARRAEEASEWRGAHARATNEWAGGVEHDLADHGGRIRAIETYLRRLGWGGGDDL